MPRQPDNWPAGCLPRGLDAAQAAYYVGLCLTTFQHNVRGGIYPSPYRRGRRTIWDRNVLDAAMDRLHGLAGHQGAITSQTDPDEEKAFAIMRARRESGRQFEERIIAAQMAGETSREIGAREKISAQKEP